MQLFPETLADQTVDVLILGAGWTSTFLIPALQDDNLRFSYTTRDGRGDSIRFNFDESKQDDLESFRILPHATTILITFPLRGKGPSKRLVENYRKTHESSHVRSLFIQLGSTGIWSKDKDAKGTVWRDRRSPYDLADQRVIAEDELLDVNNQSDKTSTRSTILNLAGLYGGTRTPHNWVGRIAPNKAALRNKGSLHLIHGVDVARCIIAVHRNPDNAAGQRWLLTDGRVYDWWDLAAAWGDAQSQGPQARWVSELIAEEGVRALPRPAEALGRALDSRDFWSTFDLVPLHGRVS